MEKAESPFGKSSISFKTENGTNVAKLAKHFDIPTTLTTVLKKKTSSHFFTSKHTRKHYAVSGNPNQRTLLTLARLWH